MTAAELRHTNLCNAALLAADKVHQDAGVPSDVTMRSLKVLRDHVETLIESVASDLERQEADE